MNIGGIGDRFHTQPDYYDHILWYVQKSAQITYTAKLGARNILFLVHTWYVILFYVNSQYVNGFNLGLPYYRNLWIAVPPVGLYPHPPIFTYLLRIFFPPRRQNDENLGGTAIHNLR